MIYRLIMVMMIGFAFAKADISHAQSSKISVERIQSTPLDADVFIGIDDFNNMYYVKDNAIFKNGLRDDHQFSALQLGTISSVDILNPLKITVFYESTNTALILDNTLNEIQRINFSTIESFRNVSHATTANDRRLWIFNTDLQQLELFDYSTNRIVVAFPPKEANAIAQVGNFNFCWIITEDGLFTYNNYGAFISEIPIKNGTQIKQSNGNLLMLSNNELLYKSKDTSGFKSVAIPEITVKQFSLNNEILYIYNGQNVTSFRLQPSKK